MKIILTILTLTALLFALQHMLRRTGAWLLWLVYGGIPLALTAYWVSINDLGLFMWIKLYTMVSCVCYGTALRDTALGNRSWPRGVLTLLLVMNILEAVTLDALGGNIAHALNALAGLALLVALPRRFDVARIVAHKHGRDVQFNGTTIPWIVAYSVWNWTFVMLNYPELVKHHTALLSCVIVGLFDSRLWLQARTCTLAAHLMVMVTFPELIHSGLDTSNWYDPWMGLGTAVLALVMAGYILRSRHSFPGASDTDRQRPLPTRDSAIRLSSPRSTFPVAFRGISSRISTTSGAL